MGGVLKKCGLFLCWILFLFQYDLVLGQNSIQEIKAKAVQFYQSESWDSAAIYYEKALKNFPVDAEWVQTYFNIGGQFERIDSFAQAVYVYKNIIDIDSRVEIDPVTYKYLQRLEDQFLISGKAPRFKDPFIQEKCTSAVRLMEVEFYTKSDLKSDIFVQKLLNCNCLNYKSHHYRELYSTYIGFKSMNMNIEGKTQRAINILTRSINILNKYDRFEYHLIEVLRDVILSKYGNEYVVNELSNAKIRIKMEARSKSPENDIQGIKYVKMNIFNKVFILPNFNKRYRYILYGSDRFEFSSVYDVPSTRRNNFFYVRQKGIDYQSAFTYIMLKDDSIIVIP